MGVVAVARVPRQGVEGARLVLGLEHPHHQSTRSIRNLVVAHLSLRLAPSPGASPILAGGGPWLHAMVPAGQSPRPSGSLAHLADPGAVADGAIAAMAPRTAR